MSSGNQDKQKVAMTTPVFMEPGTDQTVGQMAFVIPRKIAATSIPAPTKNDKVKISRRMGGKYTVIRVAGRLNPQTRKIYQTKLEQWVREKALRAVRGPETAGYDPPWTLGPYRRNEILIRVESEVGAE